MIQWSKELIKEKIIKYNNNGVELYSKSMKSVDISLYSAGVRYFGNWKSAIECAGLDFSVIDERGKANRKATMKKRYNTTPNESYSANGIRHIQCKDKEILVDDDILIDRKLRVCTAGYVKIRIEGKEMSLHEYVLGRPPEGMEIDHINRIKTDNRRSNLRFLTRSQNAVNVKRKGCSLINGRWRARIVVDNKHIYLGLFDTEEEAHEAYKEATIKYRGELSPYK